MVVVIVSVVVGGEVVGVPSAVGITVVGEGGAVVILAVGRVPVSEVIMESDGMVVGEGVEMIIESDCTVVSEGVEMTIESDCTVVGEGVEMTIESGCTVVSEGVEMIIESDCTVVGEGVEMTIESGCTVVGEGVEMTIESGCTVVSEGVEMIIESGCTVVGEGVEMTIESGCTVVSEGVEMIIESGCTVVGEGVEMTIDSDCTVVSEGVTVVPIECSTPVVYAAVTDRFATGSVVKTVCVATTSESAVVRAVATRDGDTVAEVVTDDKVGTNSAISIDVATLVRTEESISFESCVIAVENASEFMVMFDGMVVSRTAGSESGNAILLVVLSETRGLNDDCSLTGMVTVLVIISASLVAVI